MEPGTPVRETVSTIQGHDDGRNLEHERSTRTRNVREVMQQGERTRGQNKDRTP